MNPPVPDTDMLTLYREGESNVVRRVQANPLRALAVTIISVEEQLSGWYTHLRRATGAEIMARAYQHFTDCVEALTQFQLLFFTEAAIGRYEDLKKQKLNVANMDLRIAATVLHSDGTLVSHNPGKCARPPGLPSRSEHLHVLGPTTRRRSLGRVTQEPHAGRFRQR